MDLKRTCRKTTFKILKACLTIVVLMTQRGLDSFFGDQMKPTSKPKARKSVVLKGKMKISELPIHARVIKNLNKMGYKYLLDHQIEGCGLFLDVAVPKSVVNPSLIASETENGKCNLKKAENILITYPTSAGKSLIAFLYASHRLKKNPKGIIMYACPLHSLASEKREDFASVFKGIASVGITIGDMQSTKTWNLGKYDIIVITYEKLDSLLRKTQEYTWTKRISVVIIDEIHKIEDDSRGPIIEDMIVKLKQKKIAILGLSATIANKDDIVKWLGKDSNALLSESDFRPVPLERGLLCEKNGNDIIMYEDRNDPVKKVLADPVMNLIIKLINEKVQFTYFRQSVPSTISQAHKIATWISKKKPAMQTNLVIKNAKSPSEIKLNFCVHHGVAFHNARMKHEHKRFVEDEFRKGNIRIIVATPTLIEGTNLPARYVLIDILRFDKQRGMQRISKNEFIQASGRAGRWGYDDKGTVIVIGGKIKDPSEFMTSFVLADPSPISSQYNNPRVLYSSLLGIIAGGYATTVKDVVLFLKSTLAYQQFGASFIRDGKKALTMLLTKPHSFIEEQNGTLLTTTIGKITNKLYLHPFTVRDLMGTILKANKNPHKVGLVHALARTMNFGQLHARNSEFDYWYDFYGVNNNLFIWDDVDLEYSTELDAIKTTAILFGHPYVDVSWADDDCTLANIEEFWNVFSGEIERLVGGRGNAEWVLTGFKELAKHFKRDDIIALLDEIKWQLKYGISEKLISLVKIPNIGKERAKLLREAGYETQADLKKISVKKLASVAKLGDVQAKKILELLQKV